MYIKLPFIKEKEFKADLSTWNFELDDMWNIVGVNLERANEIIAQIEKILQLRQQVAFKELVKEALETLPKNQKEYMWLVFYLGQRFQILLIERGMVVIHQNPPPETAKVDKKEKLVN